MSSCILFAVTILSKEREFVLRHFLQTLKTKFSDSDFYVGINPGSLETVESILKEYELNMQTVRADVTLYTSSDASAYQAALKLLQASGKEYDYYWFIHTKSGVNSHSDYLREWYIHNFLNRRNYIENFIFKQGVGSYGLLGLEYSPTKNYNEKDTQIELWENRISQELPCTHANFFYIHTLYTLAHGPMQNFLKLVSNQWFESKLDRYYFEGIFPFIVSRSGYFPYLENRISMNGIPLDSYQSDWVSSNRLDSKYNHLVNTFKTNYHFNQLNPPYVNSNP